MKKMRQTYYLLTLSRRFNSPIVLYKTIWPKRVNITALYTRLTSARTRFNSLHDYITDLRHEVTSPDRWNSIQLESLWAPQNYIPALVLCHSCVAEKVGVNKKKA
jgi:hypothetical protein